MQQLKVAVHAPDQLTVTGLIHCLAGHPKIAITTWSEDRPAADVALVAIDRRLGISTLGRLHAGVHQRPMPIVLIADRLVDVDLRSVARYGVVDVMQRIELDPDELAEVLVAAAHGAGSTPMVRLRKGPVTAATRASELKPREMDVLRMLADGFETTEIAAKLCYSERTVKSIISTVMQRFDARCRTHAVAHAVRTGAI